VGDISPSSYGSAAHAVNGSAPSVVCNSSSTFSGMKLGKPPLKMPKLLAKYCRPTSASTDQVQKIPLTPLAEYHKYLDICDEIQQGQSTNYDDNDNGMDRLYFWHQHKKDLPIMYCLAMKVHSVGPTSYFCSCRKGF
jgi:hypothetical protein